MLVWRERVAQQVCYLKTESVHLEGESLPEVLIFVLKSLLNAHGIFGGRMSALLGESSCCFL